MIKNFKNARSNKTRIVECPLNKGRGLVHWITGKKNGIRARCGLCGKMYFTPIEPKQNKLKRITPNSYGKWFEKHQDAYLIKGYSLEDYRFGFLIDRINKIIDYINKHE